MRLIKKILFPGAIFRLLSLPLVVHAQAVTLSADGPGDTYELITQKFAPGNGINAVEHAECSTAHPLFGRHVAEVFDATLNKYVFSFYIHLAQDNDRCTTATDRQRVEIKTYESSPANLKGTLGESITYKWLFKIPIGFKVSTSFTHIHQIKPVNGDDGNPLFTLTARKGSSGNPNALELIVNNTTKVATPALSQFEGEWVEATEFITVGANGVYSMKVRRLRDNAMLIDYTNYNIMTIRPDNDFIRPKWGIYRSLNTPGDLRDDSLQFADFSIEEGTVLAAKLLSFTGSNTSNGNLLQWKTTNEVNADYYELQRSADGLAFTSIYQVGAANVASAEKNYQFTDKVTEGRNYYRVLSYDKNGSHTTSAIVVVQNKQTASIKIFPVPVVATPTVKISGFDDKLLTAKIIGNDGKILYINQSSATALEAGIANTMASLKPSAYILQVFSANQMEKLIFIKQ